MERCQDECVNGSQQLRSGPSDKAVIKVLKMQWQGNDNTFEEIFQNTLTVLLLKELAINLFVAICYRGGKGIAAFKHSNTCAQIPQISSEQPVLQDAAPASSRGLPLSTKD